MRILVTGAAGLVGSEIVELLAAEGHEVVGTSRARSTTGSLVPWDIAAQAPPGALDGPWDAVVHAAADTRWTHPADAAHAANVDTTRAVAEHVGTETHFVHVSTAFATGLRGDTSSADLADYRNTYEWSKAHAERIVGELPAHSIVRPPLVVGRRSDGRAARFAGMYMVLRGLAGGMVPAVVADPAARFELVPVDALAQLVVDVVERGPDPAPLTIAGGEHSLTVDEALDAMSGSLNAWRGERGLPAVARPRVLSPESWNRLFVPFAREHLPARRMRAIELLANFEPYLALEEQIVPTHTVRGLRECVERSVEYWADRHVRQASAVPT